MTTKPEIFLDATPTTFEKRKQTDVHAVLDFIQKYAGQLGNALNEEVLAMALRFIYDKTEDDEAKRTEIVSALDTLSRQLEKNSAAIVTVVAFIEALRRRINDKVRREADQTIEAETEYDNLRFQKAA